MFRGDGQMAISDLLLGLSAVLLIVLAVLSTRLQGLAVEAGSRMQGQASPARTLAESVATEGRAALIAAPREARLLTRDGLVSRVPREDLDRAALAPWLAALDGVPLLIVLPGGDETAYLAEPRLAESGLSQIDRVRVSASCSSPLLSNGEVRCHAGE